jgi:hypothetical protein
MAAACAGAGGGGGGCALPFNPNPGGASPRRHRTQAGTRPPLQHTARSTQCAAHIGRCCPTDVQKGRRHRLFIMSRESSRPPRKGAKIFPAPLLCVFLRLGYGGRLAGGRGRGVVLSCLICARCWADAPRWGGRQRWCWQAVPLPPPQVYLGLLVVQAATRVPLSLCLGPRLVNAVSLRKQSNFLCLQHQH